MVTTMACCMGVTGELLGRELSWANMIGRGTRFEELLAVEELRALALTVRPRAGPIDLVIPFSHLLPSQSFKLASTPMLSSVDLGWESRTTVARAKAYYADATKALLEEVNRKLEANGFTDSDLSVGILSVSLFLSHRSV